MYHSLTEFSNIYQAYRKTIRGKRHKNEVIQYERDLHMQLWWLKQRLECHQYQIGGYNKFMIYDPKEREIQALSLPDRVFQHLLCDNILMPYFEPRLICDNAACRQGKGTHFALNRLEGFFRQHYKIYGNKGYILKFDIRKYFNHIKHAVLKGKLENFPDMEVKKLLYQVIDSYEFAPGRGVPMGNQSSQWFALYYLDRLDRLIKEQLQIKGYVRYMDDGVLVHESKDYLQKCLGQMKKLIQAEELEFNEKTQIFPISQGVDFLGWHFYLTDSGKVIRRLRTSNKKRFKRRMKLYQRQYAAGEKTLEEITQSVRSYNGHLKCGDTWRLRKHLYSNLIFTKGVGEKEDSK
ncbi:MAG: reverse transcriptase domain-containing protein [Lachnospiraceae bacterium]